MAQAGLSPAPAPRRSPGSPARRVACTRTNSAVARSICRKPSAIAAADAGQQLQRLERLQRADHPGGRPEHAGLRAARRVRPAPRGTRSGSTRSRPGLMLITRPEKPEHAGLHQRHARRAARGVDGVAGGERVRAVDHEVLPLDERGRVVGAGAHAVGLDDDVRVEEAQLGRGALGLGHADVGREVQQLAVQVGELHRVVVEDPDAGPRPRPPGTARPASRARPRRSPARWPRTSASCAASAPLGQHELARVALDLRVRCRSGGARRRRRGAGLDRRRSAGADGGGQLAEEAARGCSRRARSGSSSPRPSPRARPRARSAGRSPAPPPARQRTSSASPGAIRSSSSFVRTQVIGQVSAVMSSVRAAIADTVAALWRAPS